MFKLLATFILFGLIFSANSADAATKKKKNKKKSTRTHRVTHHSRKTRRYKPGNGPDLKAITTDTSESPYKEDPNNGVTPVETKQPNQ